MWKQNEKSRKRLRSGRMPDIWNGWTYKGVLNPAVGVEMRESECLINWWRDEAMEALTGEKGITYICTFISCFFLMSIMWMLLMLMFTMFMCTTDHLRKIIHNTQHWQTCQKEGVYSQYEGDSLHCPKIVKSTIHNFSQVINGGNLLRMTCNQSINTSTKGGPQ